MELKVLIADDDAGMRLVLGKILSKNPGFSLAGEAEDGEAALSFALREKPDVVFLDVEMPKLDGITCAQKIAEVYPKTIFIFATAHEEFMQDAFHLYAFDYLVKPFKVERVAGTLARILDTYAGKETPVLQKPLKVEKKVEKLFIRGKEGVSLVNMADIILIERENRTTLIVTAEEQFATSDGLTELEEKLDPSLFMRCHKSYIINISMVTKIFPYGRWTYIVKLKGTAQDALMTAEKFEQLQQALDGE